LLEDNQDYDETFAVERELIEEKRNRRLDFSERTLGNKLCWVTYKFHKCLYNGPYFYFFPMITWAWGFKGIILF
jgi:hypothetical protein